MQTRVCPANEEGIREAAALLLAGEVVGIPTETVYGLAANALDGKAVAKIFAAKGRPADNPLIAHVSSLAMLREIAEESEAVKALADAFWGGPLTMVLPSKGKVAAAVSAGLDTVAVRMPGHKAARELISAAGVPFAAPSANLSGSPSPTTAAHVLADMEGRIPLVLDGGECFVGLESTVLGLVGTPTVLRPGYITPEQIEAVLGKPVALASAVTQPLAQGERPQSPGMKYRHYAPKAEVTIVNAGRKTYCGYLEDKKATGVYALCFEEDAKNIAGLDIPFVVYGLENDSKSQAAGLFAALRLLDEKNAKTVYAHAPAQDGIGLAVYNRLLRAAAFRVEEL